MTGDRQFIDGHLVDNAANPLLEPSFVATDPVILGVDVARFGDDESTIYIRRGRDCRHHPYKIFNKVDTFQLSLEIKRIADDILPDAINIDAGPVGSGVIDNLVNWGVPNVHEINFGGTSPNSEYADMATYMMGEAREWLKKEGAAIPNDPVLIRQLKVRKYGMVQGRRFTQYKIESKDDMKTEAIKKGMTGAGEGSPDRADGFCLTFATPVGRRRVATTRAEMTGESEDDVIGQDYDR
ncbi:hypothetical protein [uncultured Paraglaciecola sp.]|uniref:hypothetical protein n=1 Tax=uncultured Paraglaciecola sp. TaxID=1765024 RepID=UPI002616AA03|nr:hypothetical protein [uncultured Paraglaciecola sp.]